MDDELEKMIKYIGMRGLFTNWNNCISIAQKGNFSYVRLLKYIVEQEYKIKHENSRKRRVSHAKIPEELVIETFPFDRQPKLNRKKIMTIYDSFDYISKKQNIIWIGGTGTGKTGLATAFLMQAINRGFKGKFILFPELIDMLYKAKADRTENALIKTFAAYDCLHIDEIGYVETNSAQVGLFFTMMQMRHKNKCTLITSNLGFDEWGSFLKSKSLTAALIDRLTENSYVINMIDCVSLRSKLTQNK